MFVGAPEYSIGSHKSDSVERMRILHPAFGSGWREGGGEGEGGGKHHDPLVGCFIYPSIYDTTYRLMLLLCLDESLIRRQLYNNRILPLLPPPPPRHQHHQSAASDVGPLPFSHKYTIDRYKLMCEYIRPILDLFACAPACPVPVAEDSLLR